MLGSGNVGTVCGSSPRRMNLFSTHDGWPRTLEVEVNRRIWIAHACRYKQCCRKREKATTSRPGTLHVSAMSVILVTGMSIHHVPNFVLQLARTDKAQLAMTIPFGDSIWILHMLLQKLIATVDSGKLCQGSVHEPYNTPSHRSIA